MQYIISNNINEDTFNENAYITNPDIDILEDGDCTDHNDRGRNDSSFN